jgi:hypothetical protein
MKITINPYQPYIINRLTDTAYTATLFADPVPTVKVEEDGTEVTEREVMVYRTEVLPVTSQVEAEKYLEEHYESLINAAKIREKLDVRVLNRNLQSDQPVRTPASF